MAKTKQLGKVEPELNKRITEYSKLIGISKTDLLEELFNKEVEDKVLDNSFIYPEEIYYFNFVDLLRFNTDKASTNRPKGNLTTVAIVKKIPNNLDSWNKELRTYCYNDNAKEHLGIYPYNRIEINPIKAVDTQLFQHYILFDYNEATKELTLTKVKVEDISLLTDVPEAMKVISGLAEINNIYIDFFENNVNKLPEEATIYDLFNLEDENTNFLSLDIDSILVIQSLAEAKGFSKAILEVNPEAYEEIKGKYNSKDLILFRDVKIVGSSEVYKPVKEVKQLEEGVNKNG